VLDRKKTQLLTEAEFRVAAPDMAHGSGTRENGGKTVVVGRLVVSKMHNIHASLSNLTRHNE